MYLLPGKVPNFMYAYLTIGANFSGVSWGMRIEILIALAGCYLYLRHKQINLYLSLLYTIIIYSLIFLVAASPNLIKWELELIGLRYDFSSLLMLRFYLIVLIFLLSLFFYWHDKKLFKSFLICFPWQRNMHYTLMVLLGATLAAKDIINYRIESKQEIIINLIFSFISVLLLFSAYTSLKLYRNEFQKNHFSTNFFSEHILMTHQNMMVVFFALSGLYAFCINFKAVFIISLISGSYLLYELLPLQVKRVFLISKVLLALNALACVILGYLIVNGNMYYFPMVLCWIFFSSYFLAINMIDFFADSPIMTLSDAIGVVQAKIVVSLAAWLTYLSFYYVVKQFNYLLGAMILGAIQGFLIIRKAHNEFIILGFANGCSLMLIIYFFINNYW